MANKTRTVVVVGAGPAGALAAIYLAKAGWRVHVHELREKPTPQAAKSLRTYPIVVGEKGMVAIRGATSVPDAQCFSFNGAYRLNEKGEMTLGMPGSPNTVLLGRADLAYHLITQAELQHPEAISFAFSSCCTGIDLARQRASFSGADGVSEDVDYDLLIGADGARSAVRQALMNADPRIWMKPYDSPHSRQTYRTFHNLPASPAPASFAVVDDPGKPGRTLVILRRYQAGGTLSMIMWRNSKDGGYDGMLAMERGEFDALHTLPLPQAYVAMLKGSMAVLGDAWIHSIAQQLMDAPESNIGQGQLVSSFIGPAAVLIGDAAHPLTPAMGQGAQAALQDAAALAATLQRHPNSVQAGLEEFDRLQRPLMHDLVLLDNLFGWVLVTVKGSMPWRSRVRQLASKYQAMCYMTLGMLAHKLCPKAVPNPLRVMSTYGYSYSSLLLWVRISGGAVAASLLLAAASVVPLVSLLRRMRTL